MKALIVLSFVVSSLAAPAFAGTAACAEAAKAAVEKDIASKVADDCFTQFVQPGKDNPNILNIGVACDHVGDFMYKVLTVPKGPLCYIAKMASKPR